MSNNMGDGAISPFPIRACRPSRRWGMKRRFVADGIFVLVDVDVSACVCGSEQSVTRQLAVEAVIRADEPAVGVHRKFLCGRRGNLLVV